MIDWEWSDDPNTFCVWVHLLLMANHKTSKWRGFDILPGQVLTGRKQLAKQTGLSERKIRTALKKLKTTSNVTIKTTSKFSIISIVKWSEYQIETTIKTTSKVTSIRPASDQQVTTSKNVKKDKNEKKIYVHSAKALELAEMLLGLILTNNDQFKHSESTLSRWASDIDKMVRIDKRTPEQIYAVIRFCQQDDFWHRNILSGAKLRKQFDRLWMQAKSEYQKNNTSVILQS